MKEIVTNQVGDFANFVGSHFWNFQDELLGLASDPHSDSVFKNPDLNMDVLYRTAADKMIPKKLLVDSSTEGLSNSNVVVLK
ncbi:uncharacterized protein LOC133307773 isoform X2 [Gastrolobium bilobum]|uniref:uncharacterized protein LOC133307773 isoform X2 n=1 Tax=Gastrolobium bilobum TaxID=150636 RepID=UPI002AAF74AF|nr:uncharacterized protein LOC133307773 isoform X2 [Gastrolobium bilobum]